MRIIGTVSFWEIMQSFDGNNFIGFIAILAKQNIAQGPISEEQRESMRGTFVSLEKWLATEGFAASQATTAQMVVLLKNPQCGWGDVNQLAGILQDRFIDEMQARQLFSWSPQERERYIEPLKKWQQIVERFPKAVTDIEEASKCFALSRYTAAVFHSLQIVEHGLIDLGTFIDVNDPMSGWTSVAQRLKRVLETKYQDLSQFEKDNRPFL